MYGVNYIIIIPAGVLLVLAWVAWRFFWRDLSVSGTSVLPGFRPMVQSVMSGVVATAGRVVAVVPRLGQAFRRAFRLSLVGWFLLMLTMVALVIVATLLFSRNDAALAWFGGKASIPAVLSAVFSPEKLVPPAPLPPQVFADAVALQPALGGADRDWSKLNPQFEQKVLLLMQAMQERGYPLVLLEGYRSPERQNQLLQSGEKVTQAAGGQSKHQYGLAADLAPLRDGKVVLSEADPWAAKAYQALGEAAAENGLNWGGRWSFRDLGHVEWPGSVAALAQANN